MWKYYDELASGSAVRHCLFILSQIAVFSTLPENIFTFPLNIPSFLSFLPYRSLPSAQNFGSSVLEVASGDLIQPLYLRGGKTERKVIALIMHLIRLVKTSDVLFQILHLLPADGWRWLFLWQPKTKRQKTITFYQWHKLETIEVDACIYFPMVASQYFCSSYLMGWADLATLSFNKFGTQNECELPWGSMAYS